MADRSFRQDPAGPAQIDADADNRVARDRAHRRRARRGCRRACVRSRRCRSATSALRHRCRSRRKRAAPRCRRRGSGPRARPCRRRSGARTRARCRRRAASASGGRVGRVRRSGFRQGTRSGAVDVSARRARSLLVESICQHKSIAPMRARCPWNRRFDPREVEQLDRSFELITAAGLGANRQALRAQLFDLFPDGRARDAELRQLRRCRRVPRRSRASRAGPTARRRAVVPLGCSRSAGFRPIHRVSVARRVTAAALGRVSSDRFLFAGRCPPVSAGVRWTHRAIGTTAGYFFAIFGD